MIESAWSIRLPRPREAVFAWHERPGALQRLLPPWEKVTVEASDGHIGVGARVSLVMRVGPLANRWLAEHVKLEPPALFEDRAITSPFRAWRHRHEFAVEGPETVMTDRVQWSLPLHRLAYPLLGRWVRGRLEAMFKFRHQRTASDLARLARPAAAPPLKVAITGASGLIGRELAALLSTGGHAVVRLVRRPQEQANDTVLWDAADPRCDLSKLNGFDVVVHLAGEPLAAGRWSDSRKRTIMSSRVDGTRNLCSALAALDDPPATVISASAIGFYGDTADDVDESSPSGEGYLADVCRRWESATTPLRARGVRVVHARIGVVLDPRGGALAKMLPVWRAGLGGPVGGGDQGFSWIALDDVLGSLVFLMDHKDVQGPVNLVSPRPTDNKTFSRTLGRVLRRPALLPVPAVAIKALFGQMGQETVLAGARVHPKTLTTAGFQWEHDDLEAALRFMLGRGP